MSCVIETTSVYLIYYLDTEFPLVKQNFVRISWFGYCGSCEMLAHFGCEHG